ncbi:MAG TPA: hypothetical protein VMS17_17170 [Gemmataceae bacterium]|nr:hypothetical protein [Gemmataceae bacterium]
MRHTGHLRAVGYADTDRADQVRAHVAQLAANHCIEMLDSAVAVRYPDGSFTLDGEPFVAVAAAARRGLLGSNHIS